MRYITWAFTLGSSSSFYDRNMQMPIRFTNEYQPPLSDTCFYALFRRDRESYSRSHRPQNTNLNRKEQKNVVTSSLQFVYCSKQLKLYWMYTLLPLTQYFVVNLLQRILLTWNMKHGTKYIVNFSLYLWIFALGLEAFCKYRPKSSIICEPAMNNV